MRPRLATAATCRPIVASTRPGGRAASQFGELLRPAGQDAAGNGPGGWPAPNYGPPAGRPERRLVSQESAPDAGVAQQRLDVAPARAAAAAGAGRAGDGLGVGQLVALDGLDDLAARDR